MQKIKVKVKKLHEDARVPIYGTSESAGFDLYSIEDVLIPSGKTVKIKTGIALEVPQGYCFQIWDRSSLGAKGIHRMAGLGESDYRGEILVVLNNSTSEDFKIEKGDRIAQICILPLIQADFEETEGLSETSRGVGGFGSTGK